MRSSNDRHRMFVLGQELLETIVPEERLARLDAVLSQRLSGLTVLLEDLHHPQNMGACVRTVEAFGLTDVYVVDRAEDPFRPTHKVTRGGQKWVDTHRFRDIDKALDTLEARGFRILATLPDGSMGGASRSQALETVDFSVPTCLCFGNELEGVSETVARRAHGTFSLPMWGFTRSFNVSVALGIALWEAAGARRRALGRDGDLGPEALAELRGRLLTRSNRTAKRLAAAMGRGVPR